MKTNMKKLMVILAAATLAACSEKDLYNENNNQTPDNTLNEINAKAEYEHNFSVKYPNVNLNQSWDFSTKQSDYVLANSNNVRTRASEVNIATGSWYEVDNKTLKWMHQELIEGEDNRKKGSPFYMSAPANDFTIVPIYQGVAGAMWNLHVVINGEDFRIWDKINHEVLGGVEVANTDENRAKPFDAFVTKEGTIQIQDADNTEWHNLHGKWENWGYGKWNSLFNTDGGDKDNIPTAVRAKSYTFQNLNVGDEIYFYLEVTESGSGDWSDYAGGPVYKHEINDKGAHESSLKGQMLALKCEAPSNIPEGYEAMIIGCEDADKEHSDWDMNDLVLLVYGKEVPKPVKIEQGAEIEEVKTVRYMIEDLGSTDDFDFNDIVLDVSEIRTITPTYTNGVVTEWTQTNYRQEAVIRHLGGTLPFKLKVGNTELPEHKGVLGSDPDEKYDVTGWDINAHNISIQVQQQNNEGVYNNVTFPKAGEAPMIIAVDPSQKWMGERQSVPESWFYIPE